MKTSLILFALVISAQHSLMARADAPSDQLTRSRSGNFAIRSARPMRLKGIAESAERWRTHLSKKWIGTAKPIRSGVWRPRCEIVIHHSRSSYLAEVGRAGSQTFGSSFIRFADKGMVAERRIDLLVDKEGKLSALPHELTHIVLADRFGGKRPAPWADEGIATLADAESKLALHHRDCWRAVDSGTSIRVRDLLNLRQLTRPEQMPTFYGQSVSLSQFLLAKGTSQELLSFVELAMNVGYNKALFQCYRIKGVDELEQQWLVFLSQQRRRIAGDTRGAEEISSDNIVSSPRLVLGMRR